MSTLKAKSNVTQSLVDDGVDSGVGLYLTASEPGKITIIFNKRKHHKEPSVCHTRFILLAKWFKAIISSESHHAQRWLTWFSGSWRAPWLFFVKFQVV